MQPSHKDIALDFLRKATSGGIEEAFALYVHKDFHHHNPYFKEDSASLMEGMKVNAATFPDKIWTPKRAIEEGDTVIVHSGIKLQDAMPEVATIHIFRFQDSKIIEEWDLSQQSLSDSPNKLGLF